MNQFIWERLPVWSWATQLSLALLVYIIVSYMYMKIVKRRAAYITLFLTFVFAIVAFLFSLDYLFEIVIGFTVVFMALSLFSNLGDLRKFLGNPFKSDRVKNSKAVVEKVYDREALYKTIQTAVIGLSKTKTGAIMTFEKSSSLNDVIKNGVMIKAPVSSELLSTIFYRGTRLHDGAVVIRGNEIIAASVFFTPSTKPFAGKYGSRHRAALGISEITDSVTVVVSEETGRISFAVDGELETVTQENFLRVFENYMDGMSEE